MSSRCTCNAAGVERGREEKERGGREEERGIGGEKGGGGGEREIERER